MTLTAFRVPDAFELPVPGTAILAGAERRDAYPTGVVSGLDELDLRRPLNFGHTIVARDALRAALA